MNALRIFVACLAVVASFGACAPIVGDACEDQTDCGQRLYCELAMPGGYCTQRNCLASPCPEEGVCIRFNADVSYCMKPCQSDSDCRSGYECVTGFGVNPFCNDARGEVPTAAE
jgi:hypothetical protein